MNSYNTDPWSVRTRQRALQAKAMERRQRCRACCLALAEKLAAVAVIVSVAYLTWGITA